MSRFGTQLICLSLLVVLLAPAGAEAGKKRKRGPAVAVWDVFVEDDNRAEAWHWYGRISEAIDSLEQLRADDDLDFSPAARPSEGIVVAGTTAVRWLDAAWVAFRGREYVVAISFAEDALGLIEGYPAARMPDGLVRDLELMIARCQVVQGRTGPARSSMRAASLLDPAWEARPGWESREFVDLWQEVAAERSSAPPATLVVETDEPFSRILLYGVDQGGTAGGGALELQLPPGIYEVTARKPGYADRSERVHLKPHDLVEVAFDLEVENSPAFQESLLEALRTPADQRRSTVWRGLQLASGTIDAEAILVARYAPEPGSDHGELQVGLYLPGRSGWGFYRAVDLTGDLGRDQLGVEAIIEDLLVTLEMARDPSGFAVTSR